MAKDESWKKDPKTNHPQRRYARGPIKHLAPVANRTSMTHTGGGRPAAMRAARTARRLEMQSKVWRLLLQGEALGGTSFREIGKAVGCSETTAWRYALAYANRLDARILGDVKAFRMLQASQIQAIKKAHWSKKNNKANADVILRAMEREAKLLGIDREQDTGFYSGHQVKAMLQGLFTLFVQLVDDIELRRQFALGIRRQLPSAVKATSATDGEVAPLDDEGEALDEALDE